MQNDEKKADTSTLCAAARTLVADNAQAVLSTLRNEDGYPYASVVDYVALENGEILLFLSDLAEHVKYLSLDSRVSVLIAPSLYSSEMLAEARLTLLGRIHRISERSNYRDAYLARHPGAIDYIDFADFNFYQLKVEKLRYIAGFGRMAWLDAEGYVATV